MTQFWNFCSGFFIMLIGILISLVLVLFVGGYLDRQMDIMIDTGITGEEGTAWDTTGFVATLTNLFYVICCLPAGLGIIVFYLKITEEQAYNAYADYWYPEE